MVGINYNASTHRDQHIRHDHSRPHILFFISASDPNKWAAKQLMSRLWSSSIDSVRFIES